MAGWHHRLDGHEFGWTLGVGDRQGGLACCNSWGCKESDTTERLNWTDKWNCLNFMAAITICSDIQFGSVAQSCPTLCDPMNSSTPGLPVHHQLPEFTRLTSIESVMPSSHLILCRPLLFLPSIFHSIRVFSNESFFASDGQSVGTSASISALPMNIQD